MSLDKSVRGEKKADMKKESSSWVGQRKSSWAWASPPAPGASQGLWNIREHLNTGENSIYTQKLTRLRGGRAATGEAGRLGREVIEGASRTSLAVPWVFGKVAAPMGARGTGQRGRGQGRAVVASGTRLLVVAVTACRKEWL